MNTTSHSQTLQHGQLHMLIGMLLIAWMIAIVGLSLNDVFISSPRETPLAILLSFVVTLSLFSLAYINLPLFRRYVLSLDLRLLIMLHSLRMLGIGFVMLHLFNLLPGLFAYMAGFGDALTAIGAVILTYAFIKDKNGVSKKWIFRWNTFGLLDFIVAVSIGILTRNEAILAPVSGVNSDLMTTFPFVIIPAFLVQVFTLTHIIIYLQLKNNYKQDATVNIT
jgi:hypothetical protein